jgi:hypothetical protein
MTIPCSVAGFDPYPHPQKVPHPVWNVRSAQFPMHDGGFPQSALFTMGGVHPLKRFRFKQYSEGWRGVAFLRKSHDELHYPVCTGSENALAAIFYLAGEECL